eukprot:7309857-Prymnesium_polylepis.2
MALWVSLASAAGHPSMSVQWYKDTTFGTNLWLPVVTDVAARYPEFTPTAATRDAFRRALAPLAIQFQPVADAPWFSNETALCNVLSTYLPALGMRHLLLETKHIMYTCAWRDETFEPLSTARTLVRHSAQRPRVCTPLVAGMGQNTGIEDFAMRHRRYKWFAHLPGAWAMEAAIKSGFKGMPGVDSQADVMNQMALYGAPFYDIEARPDTDNFISSVHAATWTALSMGCDNAECLWPTASALCGLYPEDDVPVATAISQCYHGVGHGVMFAVMRTALPRAGLSSACVQPVIGPTGPASVVSLAERQRVKREGQAMLDRAPTYMHATWASSGFFEPYHSQLILPSEMTHTWIDECKMLARYSYGCFQQSV